MQKPLFLIVILATYVMAHPAKAQQEAVTLARLIDTICIDLTEDIGCEQVTLLKSADEQGSADIFVMPNVQDNIAEPILVVRNAVWSGGMFGDTPYLERSEQGSLMIHSEQSGSGRNPWRLTHTVAMRDGILMLVGYTFTTYDRLDNSIFACDINLLTGAYDVSGTPPQVDPETGDLTDDDRLFEQSGRDAPSATPLADLTYDYHLPARCAQLRDTWELD